MLLMNVRDDVSVSAKQKLRERRLVCMGVVWEVNLIRVNYLAN